MFTPWYRFDKAPIVLSLVLHNLHVGFITSYNMQSQSNTQPALWHYSIIYINMRTQACTIALVVLCIASCTIGGTLRLFSGILAFILVLFSSSPFVAAFTYDGRGESGEALMVVALSF
jgi:hypothetical protein